LWNLWREDASPTNSHASFFFGIAKRDRDGDGVKWRWFNWSRPATGEAPPAAK
jgi:hypothetical protein